MILFLDFNGESFTHRRKIFEYLAFREVLRCRRVSTWWFLLSQINDLWRTFFKLDFGRKLDYIEPDGMAWYVIRSNKQIFIL